MSFELILVQGRDKATLHLLEGSETPVSKIAVQAEKHFGVPVKSQKLICKGKTLNDGDKLADYGIRSGSRVMIVGRRYVLEDDEKYKQILKIKQIGDKIVKHLEDIRTELKGIEDGFLAEDLKASAFGKMDKRCLGCNEELMRCLEQLDGIEMEGEHGELRSRRKREIDRIQQIMGDFDEVRQRLSTR
jgi:hypothetical protein